MRQNFDLEQVFANADLGRIATALEGIRAVLEAAQQPEVWDIMRVKYWNTQPIPDWVEDGEPIPSQPSVTELLQDGWFYWRAETVRKFSAFEGEYFDTTYYLMRRPRQQPAASDAGDGDAGRDWKAAFDELQHEFDLYRWSAGERMTRPSGAPLRLNSWGEPFCPVCNETMEWLQDDDLDDDDVGNYWRWHCTGCGTELARDEHPAPAELRDVP